MTSYHNKIISILNQVHESQLVNITQAAELIANKLSQNNWLYVFGSGHSHMIAEEFFYRAGGMVKIYPIFDSALMLHEGAVKSSAVERLSGYAKLLLNDYPIKPQDVLLIASNSGRNAVAIEMAIEAKERGIQVIALTSLEHSKQSVSRHSSGLRLFEIADIVIDNCGGIGDACIDVGDNKVAPTSNLVGMYVVNTIVELVARNLFQQGVNGEFYQSSNTDGGDLANQARIAKYKNFVRAL